MAIQVWDKDGNVRVVEIEDFEPAFAAGLYFVTDPKAQPAEAEPVKRTRKSKAVADENQD